MYLVNNRNITFGLWKRGRIMRLWHEKLIPFLPRQQLLGQHRECCALRGNAWGKKHATVDYVFEHNPILLVNYHKLIMAEMAKRGYNYDHKWLGASYRGKNCLPWELSNLCIYEKKEGQTIYSEHNEEYLKECLENLQRKGVELPFYK